MDKGAALEVIEQFRRALEARGACVDRIVLFGSYATDMYREGSDIDLAVISEDFERMPDGQRDDAVIEAIVDVYQPIEAIPMTPREWEEEDSIIVTVAKQGEVVYEREKAPA